MKEFAVTITLPAFADMLVEAETKDAAIAQIKENLKKGLEVEFDLEFGNPEDMDFFAYPLSGKSEESPRPELKNFTVTLEAKSYQEVPIKAVSEEAAIQLVYEMYNKTDAIDFNDSHVMQIVSGIKSEDDSSEHSVELLTEIIGHIRDSDLSDYALALMLQSAFKEASDLAH